MIVANLTSYFQCMILLNYQIQANSLLVILVRLDMIGHDTVPAVWEFIMFIEKPECTGYQFRINNVQCMQVFNIYLFHKIGK